MNQKQQQTLVRAIDRTSNNSSFQRNSSPRLSKEEERQISYDNVEILLRFLSEGGRILPARITNLSAKLQRKVKKQVKIARQLGFLPFINKGKI